MPEPPPRGSVAEYLQALRASERFGPLVSAVRGQSPRPARLVDLPGLPPALARALEEAGLSRLYIHQAEAVSLLLAGRDVVTATPTASGKSLVFNIPVLARLLERPGSHALYLFPLKALAQDQLRALERLGRGLPGLPRPLAAVYDGDTPAEERRRLRQRPPPVLITNPDMLHAGMLAGHGRWSRLLASLDYIVIDEVHVYRGVFGSHMAWVLRRLLRLCGLHGSRPVLALSSATVGNPGELARRLTGREARVVERSGAPRGSSSFVLLNPEDSAPRTAVMLLEAAVLRGLRAIVYTQSRKLTELITLWARRRLGRRGLDRRISSYRAGFLPGDRRRIEARLASGDLLGVIATSALELGIDIGDLDICILVGYPGSVMAVRQRAGRVGRSGQEALAILVAQEDALDQYLVRRPERFFSRPVEAVTLNPANPRIMDRHLVCAAAEAPLRRGGPLLREPGTREALERLERSGDLLRSADGEQWFTMIRSPQQGMGLRGGGGTWTLRRGDGGAVIGEIDGARVYRDCHPGAVYLHMARTYLVEALDHQAREVILLPGSPPFYTRALVSKETTITATLRRRVLGRARAAFGRLRVVERVIGFERRLLRGQGLSGREDLDLPPHGFETEGLWLMLPRDMPARVEQARRHFMGGIHALEHGLIALMPLRVLCDRGDVGGISHPWYEGLDCPAIFLYDGHEGGVGLCAQAFAELDLLAAETLEMLTSCTCAWGCPACVHSPRCGSGNRPLDRLAARLILEIVLGPGGEGGEDRDGTHRSGARRGGDGGQGTAGQGPGRQGRTGSPRGEVPRAGPGGIRLPGRPGLLHYVVFDIETRCSAREVGGWGRAAAMGISVAVAWNSRTRRYHVFRQRDALRLGRMLAGTDLVVGFNNRRFDNRVLEGCGVRGLDALPTLDLLELLRGVLGLRIGLDNLAGHSLGAAKGADGLAALRWYAQGRWEELIRYCARDVALTRDLFLHAVEQGFLCYANRSGAVVRVPLDMEEALERALAQAGS